MLEFKRDHWKGYMYLLPALVFMAIFTFYPIIKTFITAFLEGYSIYGDSQFKLGLGNFIYVFNDELFWRALGNTALMVIVSVPVSVIIALLISVALNSIKKLQGFFQTVFFLPYVTNTIALGLVFSVLFSNNGLINAIIEWFGGTPRAWITNWQGQGAVPGYDTVTYWRGIFVISMYTIWNSLAFKILVFLSGLQSIDKQYYQAAQIDATPRWRVFTKITVPLLSPMIAYVTITSFIGAFKAYTSVIAIYGETFGPPGQETENMYITIVGYIYQKLHHSRGADLFSVAAAASLILFGIILLITLVQLQVSKKRVHY